MATSNMEHIDYVKEHITAEHTNPKRAIAGYRGAATAGNCGAATSRGRASVGENGIASARCSHPMAKGGIGAVLALARERDDNYDLLCWNSAVVDGKTIKANTWYTIDDDGEFVEVEEGAQA